MVAVKRYEKVFARFDLYKACLKLGKEWFKIVFVSRRPTFIFAIPFKDGLRVNPRRKTKSGSVVQLVRMLPCHGRGRGFESRPVR